MKKRSSLFRLTIVVLLSISGLSIRSFAATDETEKDHSLDFLDSVDYPELQVVPRASERVELEASQEREGGAWFNQWALLLSGASSYLAASNTNSALTNAQTYQTNAVTAGQTMALVTFSAGLYYAISQPYTSVNDKMKKQKVTSKRQLLLRERMAEENMERIAKQYRIISTTTLLGSLTVNALLSTYGNTNSAIFCYASMIVQIAGLIFPSSYSTAAEKQNEYKHRIYAPLPISSFEKNPRTGETYPTVGLLWHW